MGRGGGRERRRRRGPPLASLAPNPPPPSFPRRRESIPGEVHRRDPASSSLSPPYGLGGGSGLLPLLDAHERTCYHTPMKVSPQTLFPPRLVVPGDLSHFRSKLLNRSHSRIKSDPNRHRESHASDRKRGRMLRFETIFRRGGLGEPPAGLSANAGDRAAMG